MFYIYANGKSIYQPMDNKLSLIQPKLTLEMGKAGSLQFQIPPSNQYYNALSQLSTVVTVEMDDVEIFRGRVLTNNRNFNNIRTVYCEGNLAYLVDSVQKAEKYEGKAHALFRKIIAAHNARVEASKQFTVGNITVEDRDVLLTGKSDDIEDAETGKFDYKQIALNSIADEWQNSFDFIETCLIDFTGGYLRTRRSGNTTYIDLLADYNSTTTQEIEFGKNMLDLTEDVSAEDVFTVLIPLGDENLTIESVNGGSDELVDTNAVARYGRIVKTHVFDSVNTPETLMENGRRFLESNANVPITITVKAVDMHLVDKNASAIFIGDKVHVSSIPHGMLDTLTCTKIEYDMESPANNTYTFGTPRQSLTERYRKDKAKQDSEGSRGGGGGGGGGGGAAGAADEEAKKEISELFDAYINVNPEAGHIDLGTLHELYKEGKTILHQFCGIDLDAPSGNINIRNLREQVDDNTGAITNQAARIDLINDETHAQIDLIVARADDLEALEEGHYAAITLRVDENETAINAKADKVTVDSISTTLNATKSELTETKDVLTKQCGIILDSSSPYPNVNITTLREVVDSHGTLISSSSTKIDSISTNLGSLITLESTHHRELGDAIASIELRTSETESAITLKADKTTVNSQILSVTGKIEAAEADIASLKSTTANIDTLISNKIQTALQQAGSISANSIFVSGTASVGTVNANSINVGGYPVATQSWVDGKYFATQSWVESKGYLTGIPSRLSVDSVYTSTVSATSAMYINGGTVATREWVNEQLANYAKSNHTHSGYASSDHSHTWATITGKPSYFPAASHRHSFSGSASIANGHTHKVTVSGTSYTTGGVSTNATHSVSISGNTGYSGG